MTANEVLARLTDHALGTAADFIEITASGGARVSLTQAKARGKLHLIKEITEERREIVTADLSEPLATEVKLTVKLYDSQSALRDLGRYHKLFVDRAEVTGKDGDPIPIEDARAALAQRLAALAQRKRASSADPEPQSAPS